jgi:hypothetical protein
MTTAKPWAVDVKPTAEQFADWYAAQDRADRIRIAGQMLDAQERSIHCYLHHESLTAGWPAPTAGTAQTVSSNAPTPSTLSDELRKAAELDRECPEWTKRQMPTIRPHTR